MQDGGVCVVDFTTWDFEDVGESRFVGGAFEEFGGGGGWVEDYGADGQIFVAQAGC